MSPTSYQAAPPRDPFTLSYPVAAECQGRFARSEGGLLGCRRPGLQALFEGRLVAQDSSDEPASVLLQRIRARHGDKKPVSRMRS